MKKTLVVFAILMTLVFGMQTSFAACPCNSSNSCCDPCCESWLNDCAIENYFCKIGLSECQKATARRMVAQFKCDTQCLRCNGCKCESKCDCRQYMKELRNLDYQMKKLITQCQKENYKCVRSEIKDKVKCCHNCLIWPFSRGHSCECCNSCCN